MKMNQSILNQFRLSVLEQHLGVYGVSVFQQGKGNIAHRFRSDDRECLYSASKTFTSIAVGICQDEGRLKITDKVLDFFPEYREIASLGSEKITLRDLLHMAAGKDVFLFSVEMTDYPNIDWAELFFKDPVKSKPGETFFYANACTYMLGRVVEKVSGELLRNYLMPRLFEPFQIFNPQWECCPTGHTMAATGLYLTTEELANIGRLLLQKGYWNDKPLVSEAYVNAMHEDIISTAHWGTDHESTNGYGYQVWKCAQEGAFRVDGMYGQFSIVVPDKQAVITTTSHNEHCSNDIVRAVFRDIVPYLD